MRILRRGAFGYTRLIVSSEHFAFRMTVTGSRIDYMWKSLIFQMRQIATGGREEKTTVSIEKSLELPSPMNIQAINRDSDSAHIVFFNIDSLIGNSCERVTQIFDRNSICRVFCSRMTWSYFSLCNTDVMFLAMYFQLAFLHWKMKFR